MVELARLQQHHDWESSAQQVRTEVAAMRHSDDLSSVVGTLCHEIIRLGALDLTIGEGVSVCLFDLERDRVVTCAAVENPRQYGMSWTNPHTTAHDDDLAVVFEDVVRREWERADPRAMAPSRGGQPGWDSLDLTREEVQSAFDEWVIAGPDDAAEAIVSRRVGRYAIAHVHFGCGAVSLTQRQRQPANMALLQALAEAASLGCLRYLDLRRVEVRNRQLTFGRAVERVRTEAAAMKESGDMGKVLAALYDGWRECGLRFELGTLNIVDHRSGQFRCYILAPDDLVTDETVVLRVVRRRILPGLHLACSLDVPLAFAQDRGWAQPMHRATLWVIPDTFADDMRTLWGNRMPEAEKWIGRAAINVPFPRGGLFALAEEECQFTEEDVHTIELFADVVSLGYSRFLDFQRLEGQAALLNRERAAERIRAEALVMEQSEDLVKVATVVFWEIRGLGIEAITSSITFIDEAIGETLTYVALESRHLAGVEADPSIWEQVDDRTVVGTWKRTVSQWRRDWISPEDDHLGPWGTSASSTSAESTRLNARSSATWNRSCRPPTMSSPP